VDTQKTILCRRCAVAIEVSGETDETDGPDEIPQKVTCPACQEVNEVMWPRSASGWTVFTVWLAKDDETRAN